MRILFPCESFWWLGKVARGSSFLIASFYITKFQDHKRKTIERLTLHLYCKNRIWSYENKEWLNVNFNFFPFLISVFKIIKWVLKIGKYRKIGDCNPFYMDGSYPSSNGYSTHFIKRSDQPASCKALLLLADIVRVRTCPWPLTDRGNSVGVRHGHRTVLLRLLTVDDSSFYL